MLRFHLHFLACFGKQRFQIMLHCAIQKELKLSAAKLRIISVWRLLKHEILAAVLSFSMLCIIYRIMITDYTACVGEKSRGALRILQSFKYLCKGISEPLYYEGIRFEVRM